MRTWVWLTELTFSPGDSDRRIPGVCFKPAGPTWQIWDGLRVLPPKVDDFPKEWRWRLSCGFYLHPPTWIPPAHTHEISCQWSNINDNHKLRKRGQMQKNVRPHDSFLKMHKEWKRNKWRKWRQSSLRGEGQGGFPRNRREQAITKHYLLCKHHNTYFILPTKQMEKAKLCLPHVCGIVCSILLLPCLYFNSSVIKQR